MILDVSFLIKLDRSRIAEKPAPPRLIFKRLQNPGA